MRAAFSGCSTAPRASGPFAALVDGFIYAEKLFCDPADGDVRSEVVRDDGPGGSLDIGRACEVSDGVGEGRDVVGRIDHLAVPAVGEMVDGPVELRGDDRFAGGQCLQDEPAGS